MTDRVRSTDETRTVLVRTLPLRRGNYGGILQAYALQRALERLGYTPVTDISERTPLLLAVRKLMLRAASKLTRKPVGFEARERRANGALNDFISTHMRTTRVFRFGRWAPLTPLKRYAAFVVGSDQVWRPEYGDVDSYFFDFLPSSWGQPVISYAASFGTAVPTLDVATARRLLRRFTAVSVREDHGAQFCEARLEIRASQNVDPTLLLRPGDYQPLIESSDDWLGRDNFLLLYTLDDSPILSAAVDEYAEARGVGVATLHGVAKTKRRPSLAYWLGAIQASDGIVTDSFHGTVFSILFNRPFIAIANHSRGAARFQSLLETVGLEDRLIEDTGSPDLPNRIAQLMGETIDWALVNDAVDRERTAGYDFLARSLQGNDPVALPSGG